MGGIQYAPPFTNFNDVSASRAVDTDYQNTSGKIMAVMFSAQFFVPVGSVDYAWIEGRVAATSSAVNGYIHGKAGIQSLDFANISILGSFTMIVPPGYWYYLKMLVTAGGSISSLRVVEVT